MLDIRILDVVILLNCNLNCRGCNNFCDHNISGKRSIEDLKQDFINWKDKINPARLQIMGGEAFLHKDLEKIIRSARKNFPNTDLRLFTNGLLLEKHVEIKEVLKETDCMLTISIHSNEKEYLKKLSTNVHKFFGSISKASQKSIVSYGSMYTNDSVKIEFRNMSDHWYQTYQNGVIPFTDNNPKKSWESCYFKYCTQLYEGKLWKCSQIAYLEPLMKRINNTKEWDKYRNIYNPLNYTDDEDKFLDFEQRLKKEETICNMCPANPEILESKSVW